MFYQEKEAHTAVAGRKVIGLDNLADRELNLASKSGRAMIEAGKLSCCVCVVYINIVV